VFVHIVFGPISPEVELQSLRAIAQMKWNHWQRQTQAQHVTTARRAGMAQKKGSQHRIGGSDRDCR
jgi:hypothetical protein